MDGVASTPFSDVARSAWQSGVASTPFSDVARSAWER
jgi:hypothetical protein